LKDIRRAALNLLARREHSALELSRKLQRKLFSPADIGSVLAALQQEGLLNETRFIENFIHYKRARGYGPLHIRASLLERGIAQNLIEHQLKITDNAWLDEMRKAWQKRFKNRLPQDFKSRAQQMRFLHYRGFTPEQINQLLHNDD
jgi:regulatory protein